MNYQLGEPPRTPNEAFAALESTFGASEFDDVEGVEVISKSLDIAMSEALAKFRALVRAGNVTPTAPTAPMRPPVLRPVRPPVEEDRDLTIGEMSLEEQAKHFGEIG